MTIESLAMWPVLAVLFLGFFFLISMLISTVAAPVYNFLTFLPAILSFGFPFLYLFNGLICTYV